jgi:predicted FMN-binding regulatory protein PaiB
VSSLLRAAYCRPAGFRASILPMLFDRDDGPHGMLRDHLARGNPQWRGAAPVHLVP